MSPTIVHTFTRSRSIADHTAAGSSRGVSSSTTVPPPDKRRQRDEQSRAVHQRARGQQRRRLLARVDRRRDVGRLGAGPGHLPQRDVEVVAAPHDGLRVAGGAAGVQEDQVVARPARGSWPARGRRPRSGSRRSHARCRAAAMPPECAACRSTRGRRSGGSAASASATVDANSSWYTSATASELSSRNASSAPT